MAGGRGTKRISSPAEVLPCWRTGMEAAVLNPVHRDVFLFGLYTGMRRGEILPRRRAEGEAIPEELREWVFPSRSSESARP